MPQRKRVNNKARTKILIADSEAVFRLGLKKLFSVEDDLRVVAQAENHLQLVAMARTFRPDLALVQQEIALNNGQGLLGQIHREFPTCLVVITTSHMSSVEGEQIIRDGASGVIPRSAQPEIFVENIRKVLKGEVIHPPQKDNGNGPVSFSKHTHSRPIDTLTPREKTIISCLTQ
ncbi:MAG TPA: response regulator transcription factor, partial [Terriglobia bacterium]|nr:response regulator transcription factor [Terriglobia bacterium]